MTTENFALLQKVIAELKTGRIKLFEEKTERARKNLRRAGLID